MKKNFFLKLSFKYNFLYKFYLYYNLYIRNLKYLFRKNYSQLDEDLFLKKYFKEKKNGFYIDIGCHHPFRGNNTYLLYTYGWSGINIDLNSLSIDLFKIFRPKDINICSALSEKEGEIDYYLPNDNPLSSEITINEKFSKILESHHGNDYKRYKTKSITWKNIIDNYGSRFNFIDFLKIDIEGSDLEVLKTINLDEIKIDLLMVEATDFDKEGRFEIINYLQSKNYKILFDNKLNVIFKKN